MNRSALLLSVLLAFAAISGFAQEPRSTLSAADRYRHLDRAKLEKNYIYALRSPSNGVVESAIAQIIRIKMIMPDEEFNGFKTEFGRLSVSGRTAQIRYKAYLAGLVFDDQSLFSSESEQQYENPDDLFSALSERLRTELLGRNAKYVFQE